jgi:hypothetical protein
MAQFEVLTQRLPGGAERTHERNLCQNKRCPGQNTVTPHYRTCLHQDLTFCDIPVNKNVYEPYL